MMAAAAWGPTARAQDGTNGWPMVGTWDVPDVPTKPMVPATALNAKFPLRVAMLNGFWRYNHDHESKGEGVVLTREGQLWYDYRCAYSFLPERSVYQARWLKPNKLEILMSKPDGHRVTTCTLHTHA